MYWGVFADELDPPIPTGDDMARQDMLDKASIPARHFEADTPAEDNRENAVVPSMQQTMNDEKITPKGSSLSVCGSFSSATRTIAVLSKVADRADSAGVHKNINIYIAPSYTLPMIQHAKILGEFHTVRHP